MKYPAGGGGGDSFGQAKEKEGSQANESPLSVFQCDQCSKTYKRRTSLKTHMKNAHLKKGPDMSSEIPKKKTQDKTSAKKDIPKNRHVTEMKSSRIPSKFPTLSNVVDKIQMRPIENCSKSDSLTAPEEEEQELHETEEKEVIVEREDNKEEEAETELKLRMSPSLAPKGQSEKRRIDSPPTTGVPLKKPRRLPDGTPTKEGYRRKEVTRRERPVQKAVNSKGE